MCKIKRKKKIDQSNRIHEHVPSFGLKRSSQEGRKESYIIPRSSVKTIPTSSILIDYDVRVSSAA